VHRHRVALAARDPGALEPVGDGLGHRGEVRVARREVGARRRLERDRVILIGAERLLVASPAAQHEPGERRGRLPERRDGKCDQALGRCVEHERDDAPDGDRIGVGMDQTGHHRG
jgi:hypothetical protein